MKLQGKIVNWNDKKGFGFVEPNGGGERAFIHIKAFNTRVRRPINGDVIQYELVQGKDKRYQASKARLIEQGAGLNRKAGLNRATNTKTKMSAKPKSAHSLGTKLVIAFGTGLVILVLAKGLPVALLGVYAVMSMVAFIVYAMDKSAAQQGRWRTKETTLHLLSLLGGWPGAYFAQVILRHKSSKKGFKIVYFGTVLFNIGALGWLYTGAGRRLLNDTLAPLLSGG